MNRFSVTIADGVLDVWIGVPTNAFVDAFRLDARKCISI